MATVARRKTWIPAAALSALLLVVAGYLYASPYLLPGEIKRAALQEDADRLTQLIDFPQVRESLKSDFKASMVEYMAVEAEKMEDNPFAAGFAAMAMGMITNLIDTAIDGFVSPHGLIKLAKGDGSEKQVAPPLFAPLIPSRMSDEQFTVKAEYLAFDRFRYTAADRDGAATWLINMRRRGLGWQVTSVNARLNLKASN
jgi:hypothetical protein